MGINRMVKIVGILAALSLLFASSVISQTLRLKFTSPVAPPPFLISETAKWWSVEVTK